MMSRIKLCAIGGSPHAGDGAIAAQDLHHLEEARALRLAARRRADGVGDRAELDAALRGERSEDVLDRGVREVREPGQAVGEEGQVLAALGLLQVLLRVLVEGEV